MIVAFVHVCRLFMFTDYFWYTYKLYSCWIEFSIFSLLLVADMNYVIVKCVDSCNLHERMFKIYFRVCRSHKLATDMKWLSLVDYNFDCGCCSHKFTPSCKNFHLLLLWIHVFVRHVEVQMWMHVFLNLFSHNTNVIYIFKLSFRLPRTKSKIFSHILKNCEWCFVW